jgi:hypothetical protein
MPLAAFEPTIPVFKRAKTFHASDRAATVTGEHLDYIASNGSMNDELERI